MFVVKTGGVIVALSLVVDIVGVRLANGLVEGLKDGFVVVAGLVAIGVYSTDLVYWAIWG